jgi:rod shape-determining protein MreB
MSVSVGQRVDDGAATGATRRTAVAVDLGSGRTQVWAANRGTLGGPTGAATGSSGAPVRRGRVVDAAACARVLGELAGTYRDPIPAGPVVMACRPVTATMAEQYVMRRIVEEVFAPSRMLFVDTVRAVALGAGAAAGPVLVVDIGVELTEVALLDDGRVRAARRGELGTRDLRRGSSVELAAGAITSLLDDVRRDPAARPSMAAALARGLVLAGDGAMTPALTLQIAANTRVPVRCAPSPWTAAINGAALAATAVTRHPSAV